MTIGSIYNLRSVLLQNLWRRDLLGNENLIFVVTVFGFLQHPHKIVASLYQPFQFGVYMTLLERQGRKMWSIRETRSPWPSPWKVVYATLKWFSVLAHPPSPPFPLSYSSHFLNFGIKFDSGFLLRKIWVLVYNCPATALFYGCSAHHWTFLTDLDEAETTKAHLILNYKNPIPETDRTWGACHLF